MGNGIGCVCENDCWLVEDGSESGTLDVGLEQTNLHFVDPSDSTYNRLQQ